MLVPTNSVADESGTPTSKGVGGLRWWRLPRGDAAAPLTGPQQRLRQVFTTRAAKTWSGRALT